MKTKRGISLMILAITMVALSTVAGIFIMQIDNVVSETEKNEFVVELSTIEEQIKQHSLLTGTLPVKAGIAYNATQLINKLSETSYQTLLRNEIDANEDMNNSFLVIDLDLLGIQTNEKGKTDDNTDIFVVATNTLNVYYLKGTVIKDLVRFSLVDLVEKSNLEGKTNVNNENVDLQKELAITKSTNTWTNELKITVNNVLRTDEILTYYIVSGNIREFGDSNNIIINANNLTIAEKTALNANKKIIVQKEQDGNILQKIEVNVSNLDIQSPILQNIEILDSTDEQFNTIKINATDQGESDIKCIYYDYNTVMLNDKEAKYYIDRSEVNAKDLVGFGKCTKDGSISLDKNVKSIVAIAVDNAGNVSDIITYIIEDEYLVSK